MSVVVFFLFSGLKNFENRVFPRPSRSAGLMMTVFQITSRMEKLAFSMNFQGELNEQRT